jgi:hypothetical protein
MKEYNLAPSYIMLNQQTAHIGMLIISETAQAELISTPIQTCLKEPKEVDGTPACSSPGVHLMSNIF